MKFIDTLAKILRLRDPIWQAISVIVGIIALLVSTFVAYDLSPTSKRFHELKIYNGISFDPLGLDQKMQGRIALQVDGKVVENVRFLQSSITNTGITPILPQDFLEPLQVSISDPWRLVAVMTNYTFPQNIKVSWTEQAPNIFIMEPTLLNPSDQIFVLAFINNSSEKNAEPPQLDWSTRVLNLPLLLVENEKLPEPPSPSIFNASVFLEGPEIYWLVGLAIFLFLIGLWLSIHSKRIGSLSRHQILLIVINFVMSLTSAEIIVNGFRLNIFKQWWGVIPLLIMHILLLIYLGGLALIKRAEISNAIDQLNK